jgi:AcrR family transcriptional regulator
LSQDEVVTAALGLILDRGMSGLTMRSVAQRLGVTPMAVYYYVRDKDDLLRLVSQRISTSWIPLRPAEGGGWEEALRLHLTSMWEVLSRYQGLGSFLIEQPSLGVTSHTVRNGIAFFEAAGFDRVKAQLAWSFAYTYIHGRISVDAHLGHRAEAPRLEGLRAHDYVEFGIEAVIAGLRALRDAEPAEWASRAAGAVPSSRSESAGGG